MSYDPRHLSWRGYSLLNIAQKLQVLTTSQKNCPLFSLSLNVSRFLLRTSKTVRSSGPIGVLEPLIYQCKFPDARWCPCRCCLERRCRGEKKRRERGDAQGGEQELCSCSPASSPVAAFAHARRHHSLAHVRVSDHPGSAGGLRLSLSLSAIGLGPNLR